MRNSGKSFHCCWLEQRCLQESREIFEIVQRNSGFRSNGRNLGVESGAVHTLDGSPECAKVSIPVVVVV